MYHRRKTRHTLPAVLMRAGTSRGLFIHQKHLPAAQSEWATPLLAAMGSTHSDARQIDGVGGATSTTSKVAVIAPSCMPGIHVDYTFVQVAVGKDVVDFSGSCGNMAAGVGPFAVQEGLVKPVPGQKKMDIHIYNTNTSRIMVETVELTDDGDFQEDGDCVIAGAKTSGSEVKVAFVDPAGSMTGKLFPSGQRAETLTVDGAGSGLPPFRVRATLVDVANPCVLVDSATLPAHIKDRMPGDDLYLEYMEAIRREGAVRMGLAGSWDAAGKSRGTPKVVVVSGPAAPGETIRVQALSMGKPHPTLQMTGAVCIAAAACIPGTVPAVLASTGGLPPTPERTPSPAATDDEVEDVKPTAKGKGQVVHIAHPTGIVRVEAVVELGRDGEFLVDRGIVSRTARRIFEGNVLYYS
ncbi:PrpF protein-domain-containing protein [Chaetomium sp. MPI-CAGE-AT-0009]|nr:PrpF protein-domain-containing protein [Chaetomium sp. MPI-CAGE-AT-0009]